MTNTNRVSTIEEESDPHNLSYPCDPQHRLLVDEERVTTRRDLRVECPACGQFYRVRLHQFEHPLTVVSVFEWTTYIAHILRVFPVPPALLVRADAPLWSDLIYRAEPDLPTPFPTYPTTGLFGPATVDDLRANGYQAVMADLRQQAGDWEAWKVPWLQLIAMAQPVSVCGHLAADTGDVLIATRWPSGGPGVVLAHCPRLGRGVVLHHSFARVSPPLAAAAQA